MGLKKPCPKCKRLISYGKVYCPDCAAIVAEEHAKQKKKRDSRYNSQKRDKTFDRFYNCKRWRQLSNSFLNRHPKCEWCGAIATEVDHIAELKTPEGWAKRYDENNLRPLCTACHNKRHGRFTKAATRGRVKKV